MLMFGSGASTCGPGTAFVASRLTEVTATTVPAGTSQACSQTYKDDDSLKLPSRRSIRTWSRQPDAMEMTASLRATATCAFFHPDGFRETQAPRLQRAPFLRPMQEHGCGFKQITAQKPVAPLRRSSNRVRLSGLFSPWCQTEIGANGGSRPETAGSSMVCLNVRAVTTPMPGTVIRRRVVSSERARTEIRLLSFSCSVQTYS